MLTSRWVGALAAAVLGVAACGTVRAPAGAPPAGLGTSTPDRSMSSAPTQTSTGPTGRTPAGPVPARFAATSVTWVSPDEAFVLGTAPCAHAPCTSVVRTLNRGASWAGLPAPAVPVGAPGLGRAPVVWGIRFATPEHGFVFGDGLWETADGGERWSRVTAPFGSVLSLAIVPGRVLVLAARCTPGGGCDQHGILASRPLRGGVWTGVANGAVTSLLDPDDLIATQAGVAAAVVGTDVIVLRPDQRGFQLHPIPCPPPAPPPSVAVISATRLAMLCTGEGYTGHTIKHVYVSDDAGAHWALAGAPSPAGDGGTVAATATGQLAIATASAASWLFYSPNAGVSWQIVNEQGDGGMGWADLGFTTATDGVVVHGPADSDGNASQRPGQLLLTDDAGLTWYRVSF